MYGGYCSSGGVDMEGERRRRGGSGRGGKEENVRCECGVLCGMLGGGPPTSLSLASAPRQVTD